MCKLSAAPIQSHAKREKFALYFICYVKRSDDSLTSSSKFVVDTQGFEPQSQEVPNSKGIHALRENQLEIRIK